MKCNYCNNPARKVGGSLVYPHRPDLGHLTFWYCDNGHEPAYVGCHGTTDKPMGTLATASLRKKRSAAHKSFDRLWKSGSLTRNQAYKLLAEHLGISGEECHIGRFNEDQCEEVERFGWKML